MTKVRTRLLLIRHGETPWNADGRWQGHANPGLTAEGLVQAERLAQAIHDESRHRWSRVIASDLVRAKQTAQRVAERLKLPMLLDIRLRELDVGTWSGLCRSEIEARDPELLHAFERGEPSVRPGGGESRIEIRERSRDLVRELAKRFPGQSLIVVTHLGVIRALVPGADPGNADRIEVDAEELAARPIDRHRRSEERPL